MARIRRFNKSEIHPLVLEARDRWATSIWSHGNYGNNNGDVTKSQAYSEYNKAWFKVFGGGFFAGLAGYLVATPALAILFNSFMGKSGIVAGVFLAMTVGTVHCIWVYQKSKKITTIDELSALRTVLPDFVLPKALSELTESYIAALIELEKSGSLDAVDKDEARAQLYTLFDEAVKIQDAMSGISSQMNDKDVRAQIEAELQTYDTRLAATIDETARQTYQDARNLAAQRLRRHTDGFPVIERCQAQLALISQTIASFRETMDRVRTTPNMTHSPADFTALRERVLAIQSQSSGLESAVQELNSLG